MSDKQPAQNSTTEAPKLGGLTTSLGGNAGPQADVVEPMVKEAKAAVQPAELEDKDIKVEGGISQEVEKSAVKMAKESEGIQPPKEKKGFLNFNISFGGVSTLNIALSIRHLTLMLRSGLALADCVRILSTHTTDKKLKKVYGNVYTDIQNGKTLAESLKDQKIFSDIIISIISVGEQGGTLEQNLNFLAEYLKKKHELGKKIKGALLYPLVVMGLAFVEIAGVIFVILPKMEELFLAFDNIPASTKLILGTSSFIRTNVLFIGIGLVIFIFLFKLFLGTKSGKKFRDYVSLHIPVIRRLSQSTILATFSRTMNILLESGVPLVSALEITSASIGNVYYKSRLELVHDSVKGGKTLADALSAYPKYFPSTYVKMIEIGENSGSLSENLNYLYDFHAEEVDDISTNLTALIEPFLLVIIGMMVGLLAIIVVGPVYQFTGSINQAGG
jgi:type IV pilus assembly protein PilC